MSPINDVYSLFYIHYRRMPGAGWQWMKTLNREIVWLVVLKRVLIGLGVNYRRIHWFLLLTRNPRELQRSEISDPIEHSIHWETVPRNWFTKRNSGSLITPQNEATWFFCCCCEFFSFSSRFKWLTLQNPMERFSKANGGWYTGRSELIQLANAGPNRILHNALNFMNMWSLRMLIIHFKKWTLSNFFPCECGLAREKNEVGEKKVVREEAEKLAGTSVINCRENAWEWPVWKPDEC